MAEEQHHHKGLEINAVLVGLLGVIAGAIIVVILHCIIVTWCKSTSTSTSTSTSLNTTNPVTDRQNNGPLTSIQEEMISSTTTSTSTSTSTSASTRKDNSMVQVIVLSRYNKDCKEDMCSICLGEFIEGDEVRVLSQCMHIFHVQCIDTWLHSHWNCPLCRSDATSALPQRRLTGLLLESQEANL